MDHQFTNVRMIDIVAVVLICISILVQFRQTICAFAMRQIRNRVSSSVDESSTPPEIASPEAYDPSSPSQDVQNSPNINSSQATGVQDEVRSIISHLSASNNFDTSVSSAVSHPSDNVNLSPGTTRQRVGLPDAPHSNLRSPPALHITDNPLDVLGNKDGDGNRESEHMEECNV